MSEITDKIDNYFELMGESAVILYGYDHAILGIALSNASGGVCSVAYDKQVILDSLMSQGMTKEEATDFFYYNIAEVGIGGVNCPVFVEKF